jgi:hypothetical protein
MAGGAGGAGGGGAEVLAFAWLLPSRPVYGLVLTYFNRYNYFR